MQPPHPLQPPQPPQPLSQPPLPHPPRPQPSLLDALCQGFPSQGMGPWVILSVGESSFHDAAGDELSGTPNIPASFCSCSCLLPR